MSSTQEKKMNGTTVAFGRKSRCRALSALSRARPHLGSAPRFPECGQGFTLVVFAHMLGTPLLNLLSPSGFL